MWMQRSNSLLIGIPFTRSFETAFWNSFHNLLSRDDHIRITPIEPNGLYRRDAIPTSCNRGETDAKEKAYSYLHKYDCLSGIFSSNYLPVYLLNPWSLSAYDPTGHDTISRGVVDLSLEKDVNDNLSEEDDEAYVLVNCLTSKLSIFDMTLLLISTLKRRKKKMNKHKLKKRRKLLRAKRDHK